MKTYDLPLAAEEFRREADWNSDVSYNGNPLTISINPPDDLSEEEELTFYRSNLVRVTSIFPAIIDEARSRLLPELLELYQGSRVKISPGIFGNSVKPRHIIMYPDKIAVEIEFPEELSIDYILIATIRPDMEIIGIELEWAGS